MLCGQTALVIEAQYLIALDMGHTLEHFAACRVVIAQDVDHAQELSSHWAECGLAIVEIERNLPRQIAFVGELLRRNIPVIAITADADLPGKLGWFLGVPVLVKPVPADSITAAVAAVLDLRTSGW